MSGKFSLFSVIWQIYTFPLVFMIFMSFSSENAAAGFYQKYYAFLVVICVFVVAPFASDTLAYLQRNSVRVLSFAALLGTIVVWNFVASGFNPFYSVVITLVALVGATLFVMGRIRPRLMKGLMQALILVNVGALIYQFILYGATGEVVYLHGELFPFSRDRYMMVIGGGFARFTGLHIEPGGYSTMMALAVIYYRSLIGQLDRTFVLGAVSVMFTFSTVALLYFLLLSLVLLFEVKWRRPRNFFLALAAFVCVVVVLTAGGVIDGIASRFGQGYEGDSSLNVKVLNMVSYMQFSFSEYWIGLGIEQMDLDCYGCNHLKSNGVFFYMIYSLGLVGFVVIGLLAVRTASKGLVCFCLALILILCRYPPIAPVFWVVYLALWNWPVPRRQRLAFPHMTPGSHQPPSFQDTAQTQGAT